MWLDVICPAGGQLDVMENTFSSNRTWQAKSLTERIAWGPIARGALGVESDARHDLTSAFFVTGTGWFAAEAQKIEDDGGSEDDLREVIGDDFCTFIEGSFWIGYICPLCFGTV